MTIEIRLFGRLWIGRVGKCLAALVVACTLATTAAAQAPLVLGVERNHFTVNGVPKFLLLVSYFAARRPTHGLTWAQHEAEIRTHFAYLKAAGFDGIRMFPDYSREPWNGTACNQHEATPLMRYSGNTGWVDGAEGGELDRVLTIAKEEGLVVDLSLAMELMPGMDKIAYMDAVLDLTTLMRDYGGGYRHVFFDLENEYTHEAGMQFWPACGKRRFYATSDPLFPTVTLQALIQAVKAIDPLRIVTASSENGSHSATVSDAYSAGMDVVSFHEPRVYASSPPHAPQWPLLTETQAIGLRTTIENPRAPGQWKPAYFQEPDRWLPSCTGGGGQCLLTGTHFVDAARLAKAMGAAAWTFHTEGMFKYNTPGTSNTRAISLSGEELNFINRVNAEVVPISWGTSAFRGSLDNPSTVVVVPAFGQVAVNGWIVDLAAASGTGISQVQVEVWQVGSLVTTVNASIYHRPDLAAYFTSLWGAAYGAQYGNSAFQASLPLLPGTYDVLVRVNSTVTSTPGYPLARTVTVQWQ